ncbi:MAG: hypothetical protein SFU98_22245 [Leptospiraceae bacterium]|nr:hypothetical protein [Leptospiraceae bacterium]
MKIQNEQIISKSNESLSVQKEDSVGEKTVSVSSPLPKTSPIADSVNVVRNFASQLVHLQKKLSSLQTEYTREQTKFSVLKSGNMMDSELVTLFYESSAIEKESLNDMQIEKEELLRSIQSRQKNIEAEISKIENEVSRLFSSDINRELNNLDTIEVSKDMMKVIDARVVEKLVRG